MLERACDDGLINHKTAARNESRNINYYNLTTDARRSSVAVEAGRQARRGAARA